MKIEDEKTEASLIKIVDSNEIPVKVAGVDAV